MPPGSFSRLGPVRRPLASLLALALGAGLVLGLTACGEEDAQLLPGETAREITANLDAVKQLADEGDCVGAEAASEQVSEQVEALGGVDRRLKQALAQGTERLNEVIAGCEEEEIEEIAPATIPEGEEEESEGEGENGDDDRGEDGKGKGQGQGGGRDEAPGQQKEPQTESTPEPETKPEGKGQGKGESPPPTETPTEEGPSGGIEPSSPVEEGGEG